jgi:hypothetical protein
MFKNFFFRKSYRLCDNVEKQGGARSYKWRHSVAHTRFLLNKQDYTHARAWLRPRSRAPTHPRVRKHAYAQTDKQLIMFAFPR